MNKQVIPGDYCLMTGKLTKKEKLFGVLVYFGFCFSGEILNDHKKNEFSVVPNAEAYSELSQICKMELFVKELTTEALI